MLIGFLNLKPQQKRNRVGHLLEHFAQPHVDSFLTNYLIQSLVLTVLSKYRSLSGGCLCLYLKADSRDRQETCGESKVDDRKGF